MKDSFICKNCGKNISEKALGVQHRNHCPYCLWSMHVDKKKTGDRAEVCRGMMKPIGLSFKDQRADKYGKKIQGELRLIHCCQLCNKLSINRIAGDDETKVILEVFEKSLMIEDSERKDLLGKGIDLLIEKDRSQIETQLFGKKF